MIDKTLIKKLEKQLQLLKNTKSDYDNFISKFKDMIGDDKELSDWINQIYK